VSRRRRSSDNHAASGVPCRPRCRIDLPM
jgi:hypothetical protein